MTEMSFLTDRGEACGLSRSSACGFSPERWRRSCTKHTFHLGYRSQCCGQRHCAGADVCAGFSGVSGIVKNLETGCTVADIGTPGSPPHGWILLVFSLPPPPNSLSYTSAEWRSVMTASLEVRRLPSTASALTLEMCCVQQLTLRC